MSTISSNRLTPAVQYLRMSTENQRYSTENQRGAIAEYAQLHGYTILDSYEAGPPLGPAENLGSHGELHTAVVSRAAAGKRVPHRVAPLAPLRSGPNLASGTLWWYQSTRQDSEVIQ